MKNIGHQCLETHVLHTSNVFGSLEVFRGAIQSTLSSVVDQVLHQGIRRHIRADDEGLGFVGGIGMHGGVGYAVTGNV